MVVSYKGDIHFCLTILLPSHLLITMSNLAFLFFIIISSLPHPLVDKIASTLGEKKSVLFLVSVLHHRIAISEEKCQSKLLHFILPVELPNFKILIIRSSHFHLNYIQQLDI